MAKGKTANPADSFRKAQRAKELKKNKEERKKTRETQTIKRDTRDLEGEIRELKAGKNDKTAQARLSELESELAYVNKTKEAYVKDHPEARDKVFRSRAEGGEGGQRPRREGPSGEDLKHLYDSSGRLKDPTRSAYYDPVYNPFGVPPPGMPYKERDAVPEEGLDDSDAEDDEDEEEDGDDDEIVMPSGPPPGQNGDNSDGDSDDSDDIPLPTGPPPPRPTSTPQAGPSGPRHPQIPVRPAFLPFAPPLFGHGQHFRPPHPGHLPPRPVSTLPQTYGAGPSFHTLPHRTPQQPVQAVQDPLSDRPAQTYQGYHARPPPPSHAAHALPPRPPPTWASDTTPSTASGPASTSTAPATSIAATAEISAEPQLRDLRKEATAFVPRGVKRKKPPPGGVTINAAPGGREVDDAGDEIRARLGDRQGEDDGGLMGRLKDVFATQAQAHAGGMNGVNGVTGVNGSNKSGDALPGTRVGKGGDEEYQAFAQGLEDI